MRPLPFSSYSRGKASGSESRALEQLVPPKGASWKITPAVAQQIAELLNRNNRLQTAYSTERVLRSPATYYPALLGDLVFGSIAVHKVSFLLSEIKHLVVHPILRGKGLGRVLLRKALAEVKSPLAYASVRENNPVSAKLFISEGFKKISCVQVQNHRLMFLMRG